MHIIDIAVIIIIVAFIIGVILFVFSVGSAPNDHSHFDDPDSDAVFSESPSPPVLVEVDTAGVRTPPNEVNVYEYLWNPAQSAYELSRVTPLSEYHLHGSDPELAQILSRTPPPAVIPGVPVKRRLGEMVIEGLEKGPYDLEQMETAHQAIADQYNSETKSGQGVESEFDEIERRLQTLPKA